MTDPNIWAESPTIAPRPKIELLIRELAAICDPELIIDPIISTPASTVTKSPIVVPPEIFAVAAIVAVGEITQSLILFTMAGDEIFPSTKSRDAVSNACGVPTSSQ
jgi:hypothetical protein